MCDACAGDWREDWCASGGSSALPCEASAPAASGARAACVLASIISQLPWTSDASFLSCRGPHLFPSEQRHTDAILLTACKPTSFPAGICVICSASAALQALGLEVLQLLQFLLEHNPGLFSASQGCSSEDCEGVPAGAAPEQSLWRGILVGCLPAEHCIYTDKSSAAWRGCSAADARV